MTPRALSMRASPARPAPAPPRDVAPRPTWAARPTERSSTSTPTAWIAARIASGATTAPVLPQSAVLSDEKGNYVYVVNAKNEVERRAVRVGAVDENGVTIAEGLTGQEAVVLSAGPFLNPGQKIAPKRQAAARCWRPSLLRCWM